MPFILDGQPISPDGPFTHNEIQYPANWIRLASEEERAAIGITWMPEPPAYDQRFFWGYNANGGLIPKDHARLVELWCDQTRATANSLLQPTDWMIIREADNGTPADTAIKGWRESVRLACGEKIASIQGTADTAALVSYLTGSEYPVWPTATPA